MRRVRDEALTKIDGGLRAVYRTLELPGKNPLNDAHAALDAAVLDAYGFAPKQDLLAQLLALNLSVAAKIVRPIGTCRSPLVSTTMAGVRTVSFLRSAGDPS